MKQLNYLEAMAIATEKLSKDGIFLTVNDGKPNTMTIGWASIGSIWGKPIFMALVRPQRHTYEILKKAGEFTISVPTQRSLRAELAFAGVKSGRDVDKFNGHGITAIPGQSVNTPVVAECGIHFECKTLLMQDMTGDQMDPAILQKAYPAHDFHTMFFGEIVNCYTTDE